LSKCVLAYTQAVLLPLHGNPKRFQTIWRSRRIWYGMLEEYQWSEARRSGMEQTWSCSPETGRCHAVWRSSLYIFLGRSQIHLVCWQFYPTGTKLIWVGHNYKWDEGKRVEHEPYSSGWNLWLLWIKDCSERWWYNYLRQPRLIYWHQIPTPNQARHWAGTQSHKTLINTSNIAGQSEGSTT
jgi:hypothetical protein